MLQVQRCVSVHCDQCGDALGDLEVGAHYPTEEAAVEATIKQGWRVGPDGEGLYCSTCGPVLICEADGHEFTPWRALLVCWDEYYDFTTRATQPADPMAEAQPRWRGYRYCRRCCLHESRASTGLLPGAEQGDSTAARVGALAAAATGRGEVA